MKSKFYAAALALSVSLASHGAFAASDDFVEDASAKGVAEVEAGKLALEKGTAADVKTFADMMVKDPPSASVHSAGEALRCSSVHGAMNTK